VQISSSGPSGNH